MTARFVRLWRTVEHQRAPTQLASLAAASAAAALTVSRLSGGWYPPEYWFTALAVFFGVWLASLAVIHAAVRVSIRTFPPIVTRAARGGSSASIEIRPSADLECYGRGRLVGQKMGREQSFPLAWEDTDGGSRAIRAGDAAVIVLGIVDAADPRRPLLSVRGADGTVQEMDLAPYMDATGRLTDGVPWIAVRLELRAKARPETWISDYRLRLSPDWRFEIQDLTH